MSCHIHRLPKEPERQQEDYPNFAGQDGLPEIDIAAELQRVAVEGLAVIGQAIWQAERLRMPLMNIVFFLECAGSSAFAMGLFGAAGCHCPGRGR